MVLSLSAFGLLLPPAVMIAKLLFFRLRDALPPFFTVSVSFDGLLLFSLNPPRPLASVVVFLGRDRDGPVL